MTLTGFLRIGVFSSTLVGLVLEYKSILCYLWGLRNNVRFFVFFFACILYLKKKNIERYFLALDCIYVINFAFSLYQFLVLGLNQDFLGGIFGISRGCNVYSNVFFVVVVTISMVRCVNNQEKISICIAKSVMALVLAAIAELKMFFIEFMIIPMLIVVFSKFSFRKLMLCVGLLCCVAVGLYVYSLLFPWMMIVFLEPIRMLEIIFSPAGYTGMGDMNRMTAIPMAWTLFLKTWSQKLFGFGLGHCDYAPIALLTSSFYTGHEYLHHVWFSSGIMMLENGAVGVMLYLSFFVGLFLTASKLEKSHLADSTYCLIGKILSVISLVLYFYNNTLRTEAGFMMFFALSLPFVGIVQKRKDKELTL